MDTVWTAAMALAGHSHSLGLAVVLPFLGPAAAVAGLRPAAGD
ncbi:MAG TPA: hypothetical protein PLD73_09400 [Candidatus Hydrogenedentes bacterium]|jgi:hypothetical protein|nr:hypothetical protein [Candidatus Hydrogenedentota bacterium]HPJ98784.1 hypothetical protein [Candidatus Hydrogenedentota bacterium]